MSGDRGCRFASSACPILSDARGGPSRPLARSCAAPDPAAMQDALEQIRDIVDRHATYPRQSGPLPRVALYKDEAAPQPVAGIYLPMMAMIVRGAKEIAIGDRRLP